MNRTRGASSKDESNASRRNLNIEPFEEGVCQKTGETHTLWNGKDRPNWKKGFEDEYWSNIENKVENDLTLYKCKTGKNKDEFLFLPRKGKVKNPKDYATIGHKIQWRTYLSMKISPNSYTVEGGTILAYNKDDVIKYYQDKSNLQPEGQKYNSKKAEQYKSDTMSQTWTDD